MTDVIRSGVYCLPFLLAATIIVSLLIHLKVFSNETENFRIVPDSKRVKYTGPTPGNGSVELATIIQVSDIHVSKFHSEYAENFRRLATEIVPNIAPNGVVATGDLTDGYAHETGREGSQQIEEWETYFAIVNESFNISGDKNVLFYLDLRGNHDSYGSGSINDPKTNLYESYGVSRLANRPGESNRQAWKHDMSVGSSTYRIVGMDVSTNPGVIKPFNFFGYMNDQLRNQVIDLVEKDGENITNTILVGHHPESQFRGGLGRIRDMVPYFLNGHVHAKNMKQRLGTLLELEADDLKTSKGWRLLVFDHGQVSFSDHYLEDAFPLVHVSNPKDARYLSVFEPNHAASSTHVRILVYSTPGSNITSVSVDFDDKNHGAAGLAVRVSVNLYVLEWDPVQDFASGLHTIHITVTDDVGRVAETAQVFSVDGTVIGFGVNNIYQAMQAIIVYPLLMIFGFVMLSISNIIFLVINRKWLLESHLWLSRYVAFFVIELIIGPYLVANVFGEHERVGLVFPYGIVAITKYDGLILDIQTYFLALFAQGFVVYPFLVFVTVMMQDREVSRTFTKGVLPLIFFIIFIVVMVVLLSSYYLSVIPLFFSPGIWFLSGNVVWSIYLLGTTSQGNEKVKVQDSDV